MKVENYMDTFIVKIKDRKKKAFAEELLRSFDFLEVTKQPASKKNREKKFALSKREKDISGAFKEMNEHLNGKKKLKTLDEVLNEL